MKNQSNPKSANISDYPVFQLAKTIVFCCVFTFLIAGCGGGKKELENTDRKVMLQSVTKDVILPAFQDFKQQTDSLLSATTLFTGNPNENTLNVARERWQQAAFAWKKASAYAFGPIEDNFLSGAIDYPSVHYPNIEKAINANATIDEGYVDAKGASLKGLKAIEYLLYKTTAADATVADFSASAARRVYLQALVAHLNTQAQKVIDAWLPFSETFINAGGTEIKSATGILVNKCVSQINLIKDERLAMPLGMRNQGEKQPESVEGRLSNTSIALLTNEVKSIRAIFGNENVTGIYSLLDQLKATYDGQLLSHQLSSQFDEIDRLAAQITLPLDAAITLETEKVTNLYNALKKLQILVEVDVVNQLGIILTFSDNDGD